jgi:hypothetical protein
MPTMAKLIGGILLMLTALYVSSLFIGVGSSIYLRTSFYYVNAIIGFLVGWRVVGVDPGFGGLGSILSGMRGIVIWCFISTIIFGIWTVALKLEKFFIKDFVGVIAAWADAATSYFYLLTEPFVLLALVVGGCLSGIGAGIANRLWDINRPS